MNRDGMPDVVCWDCVKGRHALCTGKIPKTDSDTENHGKPCECPVCHANRHANRQPVWDSQWGYYYDPGPIAESSPEW